jgi:hypothetical protein
MSRTDASRPISEVSPRLSPHADGVLALVGTGIFAALVVLLHYLEDDFQPCCRFVSEYVLGDWGWLMNLAFLAQAGAFLAIAHGLRGSLSPGRRVTASVRLLYVVGIVQVFTALSNSDSIDDVDADRTSWHGAIHDLSGVIGLCCVVVALFFLRGVFARDGQWHRFAPLALMYALASVAMFALVLAAPTESFGVAQRVFITVATLCMATLGCGLLGVERAQPAQPAVLGSPDAAMEGGHALPADRVTGTPG